ncbi:ABC transporter ATP-binding protein [Alicyclobacillus cellulosilyticus]|uniref:ABC transporter ATP-binding protein n=1 Tax=Alicyclobacillus cellulosilyticus TaxID=1003997 RepID=A0A917NNJ3_9BACL|nr:ABC transporter ATP-binding protein [Alicyclobacillus cellulosilyticus]GGJ13631.1 ABC transporter ATP-binding protein [Alicyclobacillus cellulosilyticus]
MAITPLLTVADLTKSFRVRGRRLYAVRQANLELGAGETLGVVGESGSGKSTLGRCILRLLVPDSGRVVFDGTDLVRLAKRDLRIRRRDMQMVFQDPLSALNPRFTVGRNVMDPLIVHRMGTRKEMLARVEAMLERVGLSRSHAQAYPFELSGGQQQRVMIARALILNPKLVVCDEPLSALDVSVQAQIMTLLQELQRDWGLSYIFISHNLASVGYMSTRVAVMYLGEMVERAAVDDLFDRPRHPYTRMLLDSVLNLPESAAARAPLVTIPGEVPSPLALPSGCSFHTRCPFAEARCRLSRPPLREVAPGHWAACHLA